MLASLLVIFATAALAPLIVRWRPAAAGWLLTIVPAGILTWYASRIPGIAAGGEVRESFAWVPQLDASLAFRLDGLSMLFALLITGIGALVVIYAAEYLRDHPLRGRFFALLFFFMGAMLGVVLADNVIALFVFWELTSFSSYLLIGFNHERQRSRDRALQALLVTGVGGLALLAGLILLTMAAGTGPNISQIIAGGTDVRLHEWYMPILLLVAAGAFTKSAQFPFHFWLPNAMDAPTPVSAYLHSATMVKAGIYLLARLQPALGGTEAWISLITPVGAFTAVMGAVLALRQTDLKLVLAYSTISALGIMTMSLGMSMPAATIAAMTFLLGHAFYKGALFLTAGAIEHATGTRDATEVGGLRRLLPLTATGAALAALSMAGAPFLFGFVGKELLLKAVLGGTRAEIWTTVVVLTGILTVVAAGVVALRPFFGATRETPQRPHEPRVEMWLGIVTLGVVGILLGLAPEPLAAPIIAPAVAAVLGRAEPVHLAAWYGVDTALALSAITISLGVVGYLGWNRLRALIARADPLIALGPERWYEADLANLQWLAATQTRLIQNGRLRTYLFTIVVALVFLPGLTLLRAGPLTAPQLPAAEFYEFALVGIISVAAVGAAVARSRVTALASVGVVGVGISVVFVLLGAPDLAMTQFLVDMLVVVVALLAMRLLPRIQPAERTPWYVRMRDAGIAIGVGGLLATLLLAVIATPLHREISDFYAAASVPQGFGSNIVNVILVDFRALDTLGEITVLAVAAIGAHALVRFHRMPAGLAPPGSSLILRTTTRFLFTLLMLYSLFLLLRGHDAPGGGFIGGLIAAGAFALYLMAYGADGLRRLLPIPPRTLISAGLLVAVASGALAIVQRLPFLTARWTTVTFGPAGTPVKLGTPLLFDLGVYLVVIGFVLTLVLDLEEA
jgi:multicomponent Na+:H+ antiporter subunit A